MKFIIGTKQNMTQYFDEEGRAHAATLVSVGPIVVTQIKGEDKDGYSGVQFGYGTQKKERISKPRLGHFKELGLFRHVKEFRLKHGDTTDVKLGDTIDASIFSKGDMITVSSVSKGKGFQGVVKRYNFKGGPRSHGQKHSEREPGSIGGGLRNRVPKGMRMGGRTGGDRITIKNLKVVGVDTANNQLLIKGAIPGRRGTLVEITG